MTDQPQRAPRPLHKIAADIRANWKNISPHAQPYLLALDTLTDASDTYGEDDGDSIIRYFLVNAAGFRGDYARRLKAELKQHLPNGK